MSKATFVIVKKMDKKEFRVLMKHCFLAEKNTVEAKAWLDKHYSDSAPGKSTVEKWFAKFKRELIELSANFVVGEYSTTWLNNSYAACCCSSTPSINWTPVITFSSRARKA